MSAVDPPRHPAAVLGAGLGFLLLGTVFLLQELDLLTLSWSVVVPALLVLVGAVTVLGGLAGAHRSRGPRR